jgi:hypothetical protein
MKNWFKTDALDRAIVDRGLQYFLASFTAENHLSDRQVSFDNMLGLALRHDPTSDWDIVRREKPRKGDTPVRRQLRRRKTATGMRQDGSGTRTR